MDVICTQCGKKIFIPQEPEEDYTNGVEHECPECGEFIAIYCVDDEFTT